MVVESPYGTDARIKHINTTCQVDRLRESSAVYPRASRLTSALGRFLHGSAIGVAALVYEWAAAGDVALGRCAGKGNE